MKRRTGWWVLFLGVLCVVAVGVFVYTRSRKAPPPAYETAKVERGRLAARVTATGTLSALVTVQVGSQVSGRLQQIMVDYNSTVKKGDVIARLDPELSRAAVEQAKANHTAAQGNLAKAEAQAVDAQRQADRSNALFEKSLIAAADRDTAQATAAAARAQVQASQGALEQARAALHQAQVNLQYCTIISPIDGVVISRSVDVGQTVAASLQAPTLFTIAEDLRKMQVDTNVAEADVGKLSPGMNATFTVDAYPNERFAGMVRQIRNAPQTVQNVVTYDAVIDVENAALKLKPGMTANVTFVYADKKDVLRIPNAALRFKPPADLVQRASPVDSQGAVGPRAADRTPPPAGPEGETAPDLTARLSHSGRTGGARARQDQGADAGAGTVPAGSAASGSAASGEGRDHHRGRGSAGPGGEGAFDRRTVWTLRSGQPASVVVQVGISDGSVTELVSGEIHEGDALITQVAGNPDAVKPPSGMPGPAPGGGMRRLF